MAERVELTGSCLCGQTKYRAAGPPRVHWCHCDMCQRATGSAAAVLAWVAAEGLHWIGTEPPVEYRSSPIARRSFCGTCGTPMTLRYDGAPEVALHLGTLDRKADYPPTYHYGAESRLAWMDAGSDLPGKQTAERW